jgi:hypothetical protein
MSREWKSKPVELATSPARRWLRRLICAPVLLAIAGCGSSKKSDRLPVFPTSGKLSFEGRSLSGAFVVLHPKGTTNGGAVPRPHAQAASDGSFTLTSYEANDGAPAGAYTVTVELRSLVKHGGDVTAGPNILPAQYGRAETSPVNAQIAEGRNELPKIQIRK